WITVSHNYWARISSDRFRSIRRSDKNDLPGTFKVRLSQVADEYIDVMRQRLNMDQRNKDEAIWRELKETIAAASDRYEVVVTDQEWMGFLQRHNLDETIPETKRKGGRHPEEGWRQVCVLVGAYLFKHRELTKENLKAEEAAKKIHEIAKKDGTPDLPAW